MCSSQSGEFLSSSPSPAPPRPLVTVYQLCGGPSTCTFYLRLSACLFVDRQDYSNTTDKSFMKFYGMVVHNPWNNRLDFEYDHGRTGLAVSKMDKGEKVGSQ